jgi:isopentenyl-diphosphate delta-isomerase type 1
MEHATTSPGNQQRSKATLILFPILKMTEEIFDIVDKDDRIIGQATRSQVHGNPNLIHRVAHVLLFNSQGKLYLQKRALSKHVQPGKWDTSVGGHLDQGESYREAALREMEEELGVRPAEMRFLYKYRHANTFESETVSTFHCIWDGPIQFNPEEIEAGRFWELDEIQEQSSIGVFTPNFLDELNRYGKFTGTKKGLAMFTKKNLDGYQTPIAGIRYKTLAYGEKTLLAEFKLEKDSILPEHEHPHEQTGYLISGKIRLIIENEEHDVSPGDSWSIPGGVLHKAEIVEDSVAIEVFSPVREDYLP